MDAAHETILALPLPDWCRRCETCNENGMHNGKNCRKCGGVGYHGVRTGPCPWPTGSLYRMLVYRARRMSGLPMHNERDSTAIADPPNLSMREHPQEHWTPPEVHRPMGLNATPELGDE